MLMLLSFLFELTAETPDMRSLIYRTELAKVYFTVLYFYFVALVLANWLQSLRSFVCKVNKSQDRLKKAP
jgi:hypothetical protein